MIIYRIEHKKSKAGMWYDYNGEYNGLIKTLSEGKSKHIPMLLRPKLDDKNWFSGVLSLQQLLEWFSNKDIEELKYKGYSLYKIECSEYKITENEVLFTRESVITQEEIIMEK